MTPRERVIAVLKGEPVDKVPFTIYECMIPQCSVERDLRTRGLCIVDRHVSVVKGSSPNCVWESATYSEDGKKRTRTVIKTPGGELSTVSEPAGFTSWTVEHLFKGPEDYKALRAMVADQSVEPDYDGFAQAERWKGDDVILRAGVGGMPLHQIMIQWMGVETFAFEWMDRPDEILALEKLMADNLRKVFPIVAAAPITHANFGGNEVPEVMGPVRYEKFCLPLMQECAEEFHKQGKWLGSHMDGNNAPWKELLAVSGMDYIEAFTPAPDTDMTMAEALSAWPDKVMWINFPSSVHLASNEKVKEATREILAAAADDAKKCGRNRLIMGITEDIPDHRWQESLSAIAEAIDE